LIINVQKLERKNTKSFQMNKPKKFDFGKKI